MRECHNITKRDKQVGIEMAWHKLTHVVDTIDKSNCGLIYPMSLQRLNLPNGDETDLFAVVSEDDNKTIGDSVRDGYKLITNEQIWDMLDNVLAGTSHKIVSAGSVAGRSKCFASIKVADDFMAANRLTENTLNIIWGHGGKVSVIARSGFVVVVCQNTFNMVLRKRGKGKKSATDFNMVVRHSGEAQVKLENFGAAIEEHYGVVAEFKKAMDDAKAQSINHDEAKSFFAGFLIRDENPEKVAERTSNRVEELMTLFRHGDGNNGADRADLFNALTDFYTHSSSGGENAWKQYESSEFGSGNTRKTEAFELITTANRVKGLGTFEEVIARGNKALQLV